VRRVITIVLTAATACAAENVEILRDEYHVPHIFAQTPSGAAYGSGYAQAADRLQDLLSNLRNVDANGIWNHSRIAKEHYPELAPNIRSIIEAFCAGINRYMAEHRREGASNVEPWMIVAYSRSVLGDFTPPPPTPSGSNEILIAPGRTASKAVIAIVDPHGSWYGETRLYPMCAYGGELARPELAWCGAAQVGLPFPTTGHGYNVSIAMTPGGPLTTEGTRTPYQNEFRMLEQTWAMIAAKDLAEMKKALAMRQYGARNIMIGTAGGDIYYLRNGRVPIRPQGCTGECEWTGIHPLDDLVQLTNPYQGYMQNCGVSPFAMMKNSPLIPERWFVHPYLYNAGRTPPHQRAAMIIDQLEDTDSLSLDQAANLAFSTEVYRAQAWQARIAKAAPGSEFARMLTGWSRRSDADSRPALAFYLFKMALGEAASAIEPPDSLSDDRIRAALRKAQERLETEFPFQATYGTLFRLGRYPVGGGTVREAGMATPRAIDFEKRGNVMMGVGGQSATQIVQLSRPPKSYMMMPPGGSDDHAAKLFSSARAASTYFGDRKELEKHVRERKELAVP
jgi:acyl-homoserine lactone acylase PvdQ